MTWSWRTSAARQDASWRDHTDNVQTAHSVALAQAWPRFVAVDMVVDLIVVVPFVFSCTGVKRIVYSAVALHHIAIRLDAKQ